MISGLCEVVGRVWSGPPATSSIAALRSLSGGWSILKKYIVPSLLESANSPDRGGSDCIQKRSNYNGYCFKLQKNESDSIFNHRSITIKRNIIIKLLYGVNVLKQINK